MVWDEWEQVKQAAAERHEAGMRLNQLPPGDGPGPSTSSVTGGLKSTKQAWVKAGEGIGGLREGIGKALNKLEDGQKALGDEPGCLTAGAQKDVHDSWTRYIKSVNDRCGSIREILEQVGHDLLMTDQSVWSAFQAVDTTYADTPAIGGQGAGR